MEESSILLPASAQRALLEALTSLEDRAPKIRRLIASLVNITCSEFGEIVEVSLQADQYVVTPVLPTNDPWSLLLEDLVLPSTLLAADGLPIQRLLSRLPVVHNESTPSVVFPSVYRLLCVALCATDQSAFLLCVCNRPQAYTVSMATTLYEYLSHSSVWSQLQHRDDVLTSQATFPLSFNSMNDVAIFATDPSQRIFYWNDAMFALTGTNASDAQQRVFSSFFDLDDATMVLSYMASVVASSSSRSASSMGSLLNDASIPPIVARLNTQDRRQLHVVLSATAQPFRHNIAIVCFVADISQWTATHTERALHEKLRFLRNKSPFLVFALSSLDLSRALILEWSRGMANRLGVPSEQAIGKQLSSIPLFDVCRDQMQRQLRSAYERHASGSSEVPIGTFALHLADGKTLRIEMELVLDGVSHHEYIVIRGYPVDDAKVPTRAIHRPMSQNLENEGPLNESALSRDNSGHLGYTVPPSSMPSLFVSIDEPLVVRGANAAMARAVAVSDADLLNGVPFARLVDTASYDTIMTAIHEVRSSPAQSTTCCMRLPFVRQSGMTISQLALEAAETPTASSDYCAIVEISRDYPNCVLVQFLAARGALRDVVRSALTSGTTAASSPQAELASLSKSPFLSVVSHELRTPLNAVLGMAQLLEDTSMDATQRLYVTTILNSGNLLLSIVNDLLLFMQIERGGVEIEQKHIDLALAIDNVVDMVTRDAEQKGIEVVTEYPFDAPAIIIGDSLRLSQVLLNVVSNAVKFTHQGQVTVTITRVREREVRDEPTIYLRFKVSDTGVGIPPDKLERLFRPFTQVDSSFSRQYGGTGLGLSIAKGLVNAMHGAFERVQSTLGKGSTFSIVIPFRLSDRREQLISMLPQFGSSRQDRRCLVVVHNFALRHAVATLAGRADLSVVAVSSAAKGLSVLVQEEKMRLVIIDMQLDGTSAVQLLRDIKMQEHSLAITTIVLLGTLSQKATMRGLFNEGLCSAYSIKPLKFKQLCRALQVCHDTEPVALQPARRMMSSLQSSVSSNGLSAPRINPIGIAPHMKPSVDLQIADINILIVDDDPSSCEVARLMLKSLGRDSDAVNSGRDCLRAVQNRFYHLILMDCNMPNMTGFACTQQLRGLATNKNPDVVVIAMTAMASQADMVRCIECGMDEFISKPIIRVDFVEKLKKFFPANPNTPTAQTPVANGNVPTTTVTPTGLPSPNPSSLAAAPRRKDVTPQMTHPLLDTGSDATKEVAPASSRMDDSREVSMPNEVMFMSSQNLAMQRRKSMVVAADPRGQGEASASGWPWKRLVTRVMIVLAFLVFGILLIVALSARTRHTEEL